MAQQVVIGNETYGNDVTPNVYGHADADAMVQLLTEQLGYRKDNVIDLRDAKLADFQRVFGTADKIKLDLKEGDERQDGVSLRISVFCCRATASVAMIVCSASGALALQC